MQIRFHSRHHGLSAYLYWSLSSQGEESVDSTWSDVVYPTSPRPAKILFQFYYLAICPRSDWHLLIQILHLRLWYSSAIHFYAKVHPHLHLTKWRFLRYQSPFVNCGCLCAADAALSSSCACRIWFQRGEWIDRVLLLAGYRLWILHYRQQSFPLLSISFRSIPQSSW